MTFFSCYLGRRQIAPQGQVNLLITVHQGFFLHQRSIWFLAVKLTLSGWSIFLKILLERRVPRLCAKGADSPCKELEQRQRLGDTHPTRPVTAPRPTSAISLRWFPRWDWTPPTALNVCECTLAKQSRHLSGLHRAKDGWELSDSQDSRDLFTRIQV